MYDNIIKVFMEKQTLYIGSHVDLKGPEYYLGSVKAALSYGATTFMFYTGAPQNSFRKPTSELRIKEGRELIKSSGLDESKIIVHAPYIVNPANYGKPDLYQMSIEFIAKELLRVAEFGCSTLVLHPGASVGLDREECFKAVAAALDAAFILAPNNVKIALETMAGKGTEVGITFEEIRKIIDLTNNKSRVGVCLDTCHISDAGYDVSDIESVLNEFDRIIGLEKLLVIHINDSKNPRGAHKDRHENIGYGYIGFDTLNKYIHHPKLSIIPKILETPYVNEKPPYLEEISMLKSGIFKEGWRD